MKKVVKLAMVAAFFMPLFSAFANSGSPTDIDSIFRGKEYQLPNLDSSYRTTYSASNAATPAKGSEKEQDGAFVLQFDAVADFDVAQRLRARLQARTGYDIQMIFDAPFYKLRGGYFKKKSDAEDKARELSLQNISAFAVKIK